MIFFGPLFRNRKPGLSFPASFPGQRRFTLLYALVFGVSSAPVAVSSEPAAPDFRAAVEPVFIEYCYDCHGDGSKKGQVALDGFQSHEQRLSDKQFWSKALHNLRANLMPPARKSQPGAEERRLIEEWIKKEVFEIDYDWPDPGRVTLRRLNRVEYQNTIRDLMGVEFRAYEEFPPDDTGYGFDNIGDVLSMSPLLVEKYMVAARTIVDEAVPKTARVVRKRVLDGDDIRSEDGDLKANRLSFYRPASVSKTFDAPEDGEYKLTFDSMIRGSFDFDPGQCQFKLSVDDRELVNEKFIWKDRYALDHAFELPLEAGEHTIRIELAPLVEKEGDGDTYVEYRLESATLEGPLDEAHWVHPPRYERFFSRDIPPEDLEERREYAKEILSRFALRAFRRPVNEEYIHKLTSIAESVYTQPEATFEEGVGYAMVAVLASPRFVFRVEDALPASSDEPYPLLDEYALATRLSYFLWSTMPDDELFELAGKGHLRENLSEQVRRMLKDEKSEEFMENFVGQWLQARDVESIQIDGRVVTARDSGRDREMERVRERFRELRVIEREDRTPEQEKEYEEIRAIFRSFFRMPSAELTGDLRRAMRRETEMSFEHIVKEDRSVLELLDSDYTFLNETLAKHYGIEGVEGDRMRKVKLDPQSPRGGVLTHGSVLVVTSNPTRTSPVKRGLFVLDSILGTPAPPPPGDVPQLEESEEAIATEGRDPTLREALELHRDKPLCQSCHQRMDPLGFALENFNALGMWRDTERGQTIEPSGELITGEPFDNVKALKSILVSERKLDFYRCLTEKLLTYALGRGLEYYDIHTIDLIVRELDRSNGRFSTLLEGVIQSAPFQRRRDPSKQTAGNQGTESKKLVHQ